MYILASDIFVNIRIIESFTPVTIKISIVIESLSSASLSKSVKDRGFKYKLYVKKIVVYEFLNSNISWENLKSNNAIMVVMLKL